MKERRNNRGQVTIFIIIAILIVGLTALFFAFYPEIRSTFIDELKNPQAFVQTCLEEEIEKVVDKLSLQGGEIDPESFYMYKGTKIKYLCYTNEYYKLCTVQEPMLIESIEKEIQDELTQGASECFDELKKAYQNKGYQVTLEKGGEVVELLPKRIIYSFNNTLTLRKDTTETYDRFRIVVNNNLYDLASIANSIINAETEFGDVDVAGYMDFYPDLKVEKFVQDEGTKIFILTDRNNNKQLQFASRSIAWPPGYLNE